MLKKSLKLILGLCERLHLGLLMWFEWPEPQLYPAACSFCDHSGLFKLNGDAKPAFKAYRHLTAGKR